MEAMNGRYLARKISAMSHGQGIAGCGLFAYHVTNHYFPHDYRFVRSINVVLFYCWPLRC